MGLSVITEVEQVDEYSEAAMSSFYASMDENLPEEIYASKCILLYSLHHLLICLQMKSTQILNTRYIYIIIITDDGITILYL